MMVDTEDLVCNADIAKRADVTRAAVCNWQARYEDFPKPVRVFSDKFKLYLWSEVMEWLTTDHEVTYTRPAKVIRKTLRARYSAED